MADVSAHVLPIVRSAAIAVLLIVGLTGNRTAAEDRSLRPSRVLPPSAELSELGRTTYAKQCAACHGPDGRGDGSAAYLLNPKPRDFVAAQYRLVSTWERVPTDEDLFHTISRGMPGSAMPSWAHLPEKARWGLSISSPIPNRWSNGWIFMTTGGDFVSGTTGVNAAKMTVDLWRNVYALNYEVLKYPDGTQPALTEPSVSEWIPSVPKRNEAPSGVPERAYTGSLPREPGERCNDEQE